MTKSPLVYMKFKMRLTILQKIRHKAIKLSKTIGKRYMEGLDIVGRLPPPPPGF